MSFLAPLFLLGALAIAGPVIFHLIRRTTRDRKVFSSLMFLQPTPPRLTKRSRLEHWLLMLLRCLALALLALSFARPFFKQSAVNDAASGLAKRVVVLVDTSASMRRAGLWADARSRAETVLRGLDPADQAAVFTFARQAQPLVSFGEWSATSSDARVALATARLAVASPSWSGTNLGAALIGAAEALTENEVQKTVGPRQIVLISDLQAGSHLDTIQGYEWPKGVELIVEPLKAGKPTNAGLQLLAEAGDVDRQSIAVVRVRVTNAADSTREQFKIGWVRAGGGEFVGAPVETYVPPGQNRVVSLPLVTGAGVETIALRGDDEDFDNMLSVIPSAQEKVDVTYLGTEKIDDARQPLFFLKRALVDSPRLAVTIRPELSQEAALSGLVIVSEPISTAAAGVLRERLLAGQTVLVVPKSANVAPTLAALLGVENLAMEDAQPSSYAMLAEIDFGHPLFAAFADPRFSDFTKIHFWKYRRLDVSALPGARVLAKFDNGDPAFLEVPTGKGRVLVLASGWNPDDSQLAVSSKFVPLLYAVLDLSGALSPQSRASVVGDSIPWNTAANETTTVTRPDGTATTLPGAATRFDETMQPGIYRFVSGGRTQNVAVNLDPTETRTAPLAIEELERLGAPLARSRPAAVAEANQQMALQGTETENRQKLWRWFLIATLGVLFAESLLAGWTARKNAPTVVSSTS